MLTEFQKRLNRLRATRALVGFYETVDTMFKTLKIEDIKEVRMFLEAEISIMEAEKLKKRDAANHCTVWQAHQIN